MADILVMPGLISVAHQFNAEILDIRMAEDVEMGQLVDINAAGRGVVSDGTNYFGVALKTKAAGNTCSCLYRGTLYGLDLSTVDYGAYLYAAADGVIADTGTVALGRVIPLTDDNVLTKVLFVEPTVAAVAP